MSNATGNKVDSNFGAIPALLLSLTSFRLLFATVIFVLVYIPTLAAIPKLPWNSAVKWLSLNLFAANSVQILGDMLTLAIDIYGVQTKKNTQVLSNVIFSLQVMYIVGYLILVFMLGCVQLWRMYYPNVKHKWIAHLLATVVAWVSALSFSMPFVSPSVRKSSGSPCIGHACPTVIVGLEVIEAVGHSVTTLTPTMAIYLLYLTYLKLVNTASSNYEDWKMVKVMSVFVTFLHIKLASDQIALLIVSSSVSFEAFWFGILCSESFLLVFVVISAVLVVAYEPYRTKAKKMYGVDRCFSKRRQSAVHPVRGGCQQTLQS